MPSASRGRNGSLELLVEDDGSGFPPELLTERLAEGHVGLASQRVRIEAAGGTMDIDSVAGAGTRVAIRLPSYGDAPHLAPSQSPSPASCMLSTPKRNDLDGPWACRKSDRAHSDTARSADARPARRSAARSSLERDERERSERHAVFPKALPEELEGGPAVDAVHRGKADQRVGGARHR